MQEEKSMLKTSKAHEILKEWKGILLLTKLCSIDGINDIQIAEILNAIGTTCKHCWNAENSCRCWKDK